MRFSDKVAVVTGADSGIGRATAVRLLREGATVVAVDLKHTAQWPPAADTARLYQLELDVAEVDAPARLEAYLREHLGRVDVLANVAGILHIAPFLEVNRYDSDRVVAVNLTGVFFLSQAVARIMVAGKSPGRIVNVSSVHAVVSEPHAAPYTATKGGLEAMTRTMASELAPHRITVNCVRPGATRTKMSEPIYTPQIVRSLLAKIPLRQIAPPEWVAAAICYLASDDACYTTGACLDVDGGYAMDGSLPGEAYFMTVANQVAVVTGAASGIGRATAARLARDGYEVAMMDLDVAGLAETHSMIREAGGKAHEWAVDLTDPRAVGSVTRAIAVTVGAPHVLVNVAGIGVAANVLETSDEDWHRVLSVNLTGPFLTTRATLPLMLDRGSGVIINIASVGGQIGIARRAAYCASKAGLVGLTKAVAVDHAAAGIRCVAICPGTVETEWIGKILADAPDPVAARTAMAARQLDGRMGSPDEVAAMVAFVAGPEGRFINGATLVLDGGMTAV